MDVLRHLRAIVVLPFVATVVVPGAIVFFAGMSHVGWDLPPALWFFPFTIAGLLIAAGLALFVWTVSLFATGAAARWRPGTPRSDWWLPARTVTCATR